jgi:hypothetical protein
MGWMKKIFSGSDKITLAHYHQESDDDEVSDGHTKSPVGSFSLPFFLYFLAFE